MRRKLEKNIAALEFSRKCKVKNRFNSNSISMNSKGIFTSTTKLLTPGIKGHGIN